jgi:UDP-arabinose 4-epimerase
MTGTSGRVTIAEAPTEPHRGCVLVTGGAGYVGSHVCKQLALAGYTPVTYDSMGTGHASLVRWGPLEVGDVTDRARLDEVMRRYAPTAVLHFAAHAYVGESVRDPGRYYANNVGGSLALLASMVAHGVDALVFSSTCATFGTPTRLPITEDHAQAPISPYGASKAMVERILRDHDRAHGLRSVSLRYFNAAGADPDGETGELHVPETHLIPLVLEVAAGTLPAIDILGDDYPTPDGTCIRDYVHVTDLARAHVLALDHLGGGGPSTAFNLGTGRGASVLEVVEQVRAVTGAEIPVRVRSRRPGDPPELVAASGRAATELGWVPARSQLSDIVRDAWGWRGAQARVTRAPRSS